jgi:hypothetical protein
MLSPGRRTYARTVHRRLALPAVAAVLLVAGCGGSDRDAAAAASPTATSAPPAVNAAPTCLPATDSDLEWPEGVPDDLPVPPGAELSEVQDRQDNLTVVQFSTPISIRESVLFVIDALPAAGYTLARGDAENTEADAPFVKGDLRGVLRMVAVEQCRTDWLMAIAQGAPASGGSPLLPPRPNASPLPFG